jgi:23S rRNA (adenine2503-C2)-methyltransferase
MGKKSIHECSLDDVRAYVTSHGEGKFRAAQIFEWIYKKNIAHWDECTNIPKKLREHLARDFCVSSLVFKKSVQSTKKDTTKILYETEDGRFIETVLIYGFQRVTVCLSSQIGCKYGCSFCASCKGGFIRNLLTREIIDQFLLAERYSKKKITNIVFMGMGEPLDNLDAVVASIRRITADEGIGFSQRRITLSTCGLIPELKKFADEQFSHVKLSLSIHAAFDEKRKKIMPIACTYSLDDLCATLSSLSDCFKRTVTFEYIVIKDFNDSDSDARELAKRANQAKAKVNLIGYNRIDGVPYLPPTNKEMDQFLQQLKERGLQVTLRYSAGSDITAACGQLRLRQTGDDECGVAGS